MTAFTDRHNRHRPNLALTYRDEQRRLRYLTPSEYLDAFYGTAVAPSPNGLDACPREITVARDGTSGWATRLPVPAFRQAQVGGWGKKRG